MIDYNKSNLNEHIIKEKQFFNYGGSETKKKIMLDDMNWYMVKFPDHPRELDKKDILSYVNNAFSEYIGCKIAKSMELPVQEVFLAKYSNEDKSKEWTVCGCKDLCGNGEMLSEIEDQNLGSIDVKYNLTFPSAEAIFDRLAKKGFDRDEVSTFYYDMFILDAFIGNTDRHNGNWGIIANAETEANARISPIYDCGSSLSPMVSDIEIEQQNLKGGDSAIDKFAANMALSKYSALTDKDENRLNYHDFICSAQNREVNEALKRMIVRVDMEKINDIISNTPYINNQRLSFYKSYVKSSYEQTLIKGLIAILDKERPLDNVTQQEFDCYEYYKRNIRQIKDLPLYVKTKINIEGYCLEVMRITNQYALIIEDNKAKDIISLQSNNDKVRVTKKVLDFVISHSQPEKDLWMEAIQNTMNLNDDFKDNKKETGSKIQTENLFKKNSVKNCEVDIADEFER